MNKEAMISAINSKFEELKTALEGDDLKKIRELTLDLHAMVHPAEISGRDEKTIADYVLDYMMMGNQNVFVKRETWDTDLKYAGSKTVPICWQFWHTYRIEDLVSNILMDNGDQIFNDDWQKRIGSSITDTGNALEPDELASWAKAVNVEELRNYMIEVGKNTRRILSGLTLEQIKSMVPEEWVMRILEEGGVTTDFRSVWLLVFWGRLTIGGMILTPMTSHHMMHLPTALESIPQHICQMEEILDTAQQKMDDLEQRIADYKEYQAKIRELEAYYTSRQWKDDFAMDEEGKFPEDMKKGVLSEDGIYNMLERNKEIMTILDGFDS